MGNFQLLQLVDSIYLSLSVVLFARVKRLIKHSSEMYWPIWWHVLCIIMEGPQTSELFNITSIHTFYIDVHISLRGSCKTRLNDRELMWNDSNNCSDNNKRTSFFFLFLAQFLFITNATVVSDGKKYELRFSSEDRLASWCYSNGHPLK